MRKLIGCIVICFPTWGAAEDVVVAALGDSLTQGFGLLPKDGFVPQLQQWLDAQNIDAQIINAGVSGDTTAGGLARVAWTLTPEVDALIVALGGNDLLRGLDPVVSRENIAGILEVAAGQNIEVCWLACRHRATLDQITKPRSTRSIRNWPLNTVSCTRQTFFMGLSAMGGDLASVREFMQPDGIHPNAEGVARIVEALGPDVVDLVRSTQSGS